jgi:hypothetical protein
MRKKRREKGKIGKRDIETKANYDKIGTRVC